jgi:hypothetical protein
MDAGRRLDPQASSGVQTPPAEKSEHPLHGCVGQLDTISNNGASRCVGNSEHKNPPARPPTQLDNFLLPAVDDDSKYEGCQHPSYDLNGYHKLSSFPLNFRHSNDTVNTCCQTSLHLCSYTLLSSAMAPKSFNSTKVVFTNLTTQKRCALPTALGASPQVCPTDPFLASPS